MNVAVMGIGVAKQALQVHDLDKIWAGTRKEAILSFSAGKVYGESSGEPYRSLTANFSLNP